MATMTRKPEAVGIDVVRVPLPDEVNGDVTTTLDLPALTVVLGAVVIPAPEDDHDDVRLDGFGIEVTVDDTELLTARLTDGIVDTPSFIPLPFRDAGTDPVILTPREGGAEIIVVLTKEKKSGKAKAKQTTTRVRDWSRWECWIYVAR
jgi:hypothetical protein